MKYTVHDVLAGAYLGKKYGPDHGLTHASIADGRTALCGRVKADSLADIASGPVTCERCLAKIAREKTPTVDECELSDVHQSKALIAGNDECTCKLCGRVRRYYDAHTARRTWMLGGAL